MVALELAIGGVRTERRRSRWLYALAALPPLVGIVTALLAPAPHGHWVEHLSSVGFKSTQLAVLLTLLALLGWRALSAPLAVALGVVGAGIVLQVFGDAQVARAIWRTTGDPGFGGGYAAGHDNSGLGDLIVILGGFAFAIVAGLSRRVRAWQAICAVVPVIVPPPYLWPAVGVLFLMLHAVISGAGFVRRSAAQPT